MQDNKDLEQASLAHAPGLLAARAVEAVEQLDGDGVGGGDGEGDTGVESALKDVLGDVEWSHD